MTRTRRGLTLGGLIMAAAAGTYAGVTILGAWAILDGDAFTAPIVWPASILPAALLGAAIGAAVGWFRRRTVFPAVIIGAVSLPVCLAVSTARDLTGGPVILAAGFVAVAYHIARRLHATRLHATRLHTTAQRQPADHARR